MSTDALFTRFAARDPRLLADVRAGDPTAVRDVSRLLRLTPLAVLSVHAGALVDVLVAVPDLGDRLRASWTTQDPVTASRLLAWAGQARQRADRDPLLGAA